MNCGSSESICVKEPALAREGSAAARSFAAGMGALAPPLPSVLNMAVNAPGLLAAGGALAPPNVPESGASAGLGEVHGGAIGAGASPDTVRSNSVNPPGDDAAEAGRGSSGMKLGADS